MPRLALRCMLNILQTYTETVHVNDSRIIIVIIIIFSHGITGITGVTSGTIAWYYTGMCCKIALNLFSK